MNHLVIFNYETATIIETCVNNNSEIDNVLEDNNFDESTCNFWVNDKAVDVDESLMLDSEPNSNYGVFFDTEKWKMVFVPLTKNDVRFLDIHYNEALKTFSERFGFDNNFTTFMSSNEEIQYFWK